MSRIDVNNITMKFKTTVALKGVSISFKENKIYGLFGRNGAGKTTLLNLITNKLIPDSGEILIDGENCFENDKAQSKIYLMSDKNLYPENMKISEVYKWSRAFYPDFDMEYARLLSDKFSLKLNKNIKGLSTGYSSIFKIIVALSCNAPIIMLDEPILGLDANHRELFYRELINNYSEKPRTIVISTHLIDEISEVVEQVVILKEGRVIFDDNAETMLKMGYSVSGAANLIDKYIIGKDVLSVNTLGGLKTACLLGEADQDRLLNGLEISKLDLQQLFIELTNS